MVVYAAVVFLLAPCMVLAALSVVATGERSPLRAVERLTRPYDTPGYNMATCSRVRPRQTNAPSCPETPRLRARLERPRGPDTGLAFCRCQSAPRSIRLKVVRKQGRTAWVNAWWDLGSASFVDTFVVKQTARGWLVDDEYCAGRPRTTIYGRAGLLPCHQVFVNGKRA